MHSLALCSSSQYSSAFLLIALSLPYQEPHLHPPKEKTLARMINDLLIVKSHEHLTCLAGDMVLPWLLDYRSPLLPLLSMSTFNKIS